MSDPISEYREALRYCAGLSADTQLEVYDSNSWRRVGLKGEYRTLMQPVVASDGHPDIAGGDILRALVAAFNAMPSALAAIDAKQARIDALMLEWCPDEMTPEQLAEYERNQKPVSPEHVAEMGKVLL